MIQVSLHNYFPFNVSSYLKGRSSGNFYRKMAGLTRSNFQQHHQIFIDIPYYITKISDEFLEGLLGEILTETPTFTEFKNRVQIRASIHSLGDQIQNVHKRVMTSKRRQDKTKLDKVGVYLDFEEIRTNTTEVIAYEKTV